MWKFRRVKEKTMAPALIPGAMIITSRKPVQKGDIVLVEHGNAELVRRVAKVDGQKLTVEGDKSPKKRLEIAKKQLVGKVIFALPGAASAPKSHTMNARIVSSVCAGVLIILAVAQLVTFDKFIELLDSFWLPGVDGALLGAIIVSLEVLALPYLLHMALSGAARVVSMVSGWLVAIVWLSLGIYLLNTTHALHSAGLLGTIIATPPGLWLPVFASGLLALVITSDWMLGGV